jgi:hypothetical protein
MDAPYQIAARWHSTISPATGDHLRTSASSLSSKQEAPMLKFGISMFFTDYSIGPGELGQALEQRG